MNRREWGIKTNLCLYHVPYPDFMKSIPTSNWFYINGIENCRIQKLWSYFVGAHMCKHCWARGGWRLVPKSKPPAALFLLCVPPSLHCFLPTIFPVSWCIFLDEALLRHVNCDANKIYPSPSTTSRAHELKINANKVQLVWLLVAIRHHQSHYCWNVVFVVVAVLSFSSLFWLLFSFTIKGIITVISRLAPSSPKSTQPKLPRGKTR